MRALFMHGWGFDAEIWRPVLDILNWPDVDCPDRGYFAPAYQPSMPSYPFLAIGHSLGALILLQSSLQNCAGLIVINGFDRFSGDNDDATAVPRKLLDRMILRFDKAPEQVLDDFRQRAGEKAPAPHGLNKDQLLADLWLLRNADARKSAAALPFPLLLLHGEEDAIVPQPMQAAGFAATANLERASLAGHGHMLPISAPNWCAGHIASFADRLGTCA